ncbi:hypothetical protein BLA29_013991 [Euroglyphus maynei]|uniref:Uncharacterized protein n=1 Tax=Euroglyphus maynei TaxID=6958 RepID=A0A1Y3BJA4_EURMA|nr:hypothetical protein BLA29_013991 [Euroglyphus maynei]
MTMMMMKRKRMKYKLFMMNEVDQIKLLN